MDREEMDKPDRSTSFDDVGDLLSWALGSPVPPDEFDAIIKESYGVRTWRWKLGQDDESNSGGA